VLERHLRALVHKQFLRPARLPGGQDGFRFRHILVRRAAYRRLPKDDRADIHERYAEWLGPLPVSETSSERAELLGHHFERAHAYRSQLSPGDVRISYLADRAAGYLASAGTAAFARADFRAADQLLRRATALMPADDARLPALLYDRGTSLITLGQMAEADAVLTQAVEAGELAQDERSQWRARLDRVYARAEIDPGGVNIRGQEDLAHEAMRVLKRSEDGRGMARAWIVVGAVEEMRGRIALQESAAEQVLEYALRGGTYREIAWGRQRLAEVILTGPTPVGEGIARCEELTVRRELRVGDVALLSAAALLHAMQGRFDVGRQLIGDGRELMERLGHINPLISTMRRRGELELLATDLGAAENTLRQAHDLATLKGISRTGSEIAGILARAVLHQGRPAEAQELADELRQGAPPESLPAQARWRAIQAAIHTARGEADAAVALATEATTMLSDTDLLTLRADVLTDLAAAFAACGDTAKAGEAAQRALALYVRKENSIGAEYAHKLLGVT